MSKSERRKLFEQLAESEPDRIDARVNDWLAEHKRAPVKEQFRLALMIASANRAACHLRAMRAARLRTYSQGY